MKKQVRLLSFLVAVTFAVGELSASVALAFPATGVPAVGNVILGLHVPESAGFVEDSYQAPSHRSNGKTLILLQDAHTNPSGQLNIARILENALREHSIRYVFLEAGTGDNSISFMRRYGSQAERRRVGLQYLNKGVFQGSEFLDLTSGLDFKLWGVENPALYDEALEVYGRVAKGRDKTKTYLLKVRNLASELKAKVLNPSLAFLDTQRELYRSEQISLAEYFAVLSAEAERQAIDLTEAHPNLAVLKELKSREEAVDFKQASKEQAEAIRALNPDDQKELTAIWQSFKDRSPKFRPGSEQTQGAFLPLLKEKLGNKIEGYPALTGYLAYFEASRALNAVGMLDELRSLEEDLFAGRIQSGEERKLMEAAEAVRVLESLIDLQLMPEEFEDYLRGRSGHSLEKTTGFLNRKTLDLNTLQDKALPLEPEHQKLFDEAERFYQLTYARDGEFLTSIDSKMKGENIDAAVLVTGGYHSSNIKKLLRSAGYSYLSVIPQVLYATNHERYEKILLSQRNAADSGARIARSSAEKSSVYTMMVSNSGAGARFEGRPVLALVAEDLRVPNPAEITSVLDGRARARSQEVTQYLSQENARAASDTIPALAASRLATKGGVEAAATALKLAAERVEDRLPDGSVGLADSVVRAIRNDRFVDALESLDGFQRVLRAGAENPLTRELEELRSRLDIFVNSAGYFDFNYKRLNKIITDNAPDSRMAERWIDLIGEYRSIGQFGAIWDELKKIRSYVGPEERPEFDRLAGNLGVAITKYLRNTREFEAARERSQMVAEMSRRRRESTNAEDKNFALPDSIIGPPLPGDIVVFENELPFMANPDTARRVAGPNLVSEEDYRSAEQIAADLTIVKVPGVGGLSRRGGIYANYLKWVPSLGWLDLNNLRLARFAAAVRKFKKAAVVLVESYFTHHKVNESLERGRADLGVFGGTAGKAMSTVTPVINAANGDLYRPYDPDGLGNASHFDLALQPLLQGAYGDLLTAAAAKGERDKVYAATANMNAPLSAVSAAVVGDLHRRREKARTDGRPVPFVAFQTAPLKGEKGGMLARIRTASGEILAIVEGFLLSKQSLNRMTQNTDQFPAFNTNQAVFNVGGFVDFLFDGTGITDADLTTEALRNPETYRRVLAAVNGRFKPVANAQDYQNFDFRNNFPTFIEEKVLAQEQVTVHQVSTMLNALATIGPGAVYYHSPRDIEAEGLEHRAYAEYKVPNQSDRVTALKALADRIAALEGEKTNLQAGPAGIGIAEKIESLRTEIETLNERKAQLAASLVADPRDNFQRAADLLRGAGLLALKPGQNQIRGLDKDAIIDYIQTKLPDGTQTVELDVRQPDGDLALQRRVSGDISAVLAELHAALPESGPAYGPLTVTTTGSAIQLRLDALTPLNFTALTTAGSGAVVSASATVSRLEQFPYHADLGVGPDSLDFNLTSGEIAGLGRIALRRNFSIRLNDLDALKALKDEPGVKSFAVAPSQVELWDEAAKAGASILEIGGLADGGAVARFKAQYPNILVYTRINTVDVTGRALFYQGVIRLIREAAKRGTDGFVVGPYLRDGIRPFGTTDIDEVEKLSRRGAPPIVADGVNDRLLEVYSLGEKIVAQVTAEPSDLAAELDNLRRGAIAAKRSIEDSGSRLATGEPVLTIGGGRYVTQERHELTVNVGSTLQGVTAVLDLGRSSAAGNTLVYNLEAGNERFGSAEIPVAFEQGVPVFGEVRLSTPSLRRAFQDGYGVAVGATEVLDVQAAITGELPGQITLTPAPETAAQDTGSRLAGLTKGQILSRIDDFPFEVGLHTITGGRAFESIRGNPEAIAKLAQIALNRGFAVGIDNIPALQLVSASGVRRGLKVFLTDAEPSRIRAAAEAGAEVFFLSNLPEKSELDAIRTDFPHILVYAEISVVDEAGNPLRDDAVVAAAREAKAAGVDSVLLKPYVRDGVRPITTAQLAEIAGMFPRVRPGVAGGVFENRVSEVRNLQVPVLSALGVNQADPEAFEEQIEQHAQRISEGGAEDFGVRGEGPSGGYVPVELGFLPNGLLDELGIRVESEIQPLRGKVRLQSAPESLVVAMSLLQGVLAVPYVGAGPKADKAADGNASLGTDRSLREYVDLTGEAVVVLGDEGAKDGSVSLGIGDIYFKQQGRLVHRSFEADLGSDLSQLKKLVGEVAQAAPAVRFYVGDAVEGTALLVAPEAAEQNTNSLSLSGFIDLSVQDFLGEEGHLLSDSGVRSLFVGGDFEPLDGVTPFSSPSQVLGALARSRGVQDLRELGMSFFALGRRTVAKSDDAWAVAHRNDQNFRDADSNGIAAFSRPDGNFGPLAFGAAGLSKVFSIDRGGNPETALATAIALNHGFDVTSVYVAPKATTERLNPDTAFGFDEKEKAKIAPFGILRADGSVRQTIRAKGIVAVTVLTGLETEVYGEKASNLFPKVQVNEESNSLVLHTLISSPEGTAVVRTTVRPERAGEEISETLDRIKAVRNSGDAASASRLAVGRNAEGVVTSVGDLQVTGLQRVVQVGPVAVTANNLEAPRLAATRVIIARPDGSSVTVEDPAFTDEPITLSSEAFAARSLGAEQGAQTADPSVADVKNEFIQANKPIAELTRVKTVEPTVLEFDLEVLRSAGDLAPEVLANFVTAAATLPRGSLVRFMNGDLQSFVADPRFAAAASRLASYNEKRVRSTGSGLFFAQGEKLPDGYEGPEALTIRFAPESAYDSIRNLNLDPNRFRPVFLKAISPTGDTKRGAVYPWQGLTSFAVSLALVRNLDDQAAQSQEGSWLHAMYRKVNPRGARTRTITPNELFEAFRTMDRLALTLEPLARIPINELIGLFKLGARMAEQSA